MDFEQGTYIALCIAFMLIGCAVFGVVKWRASHIPTQRHQAAMREALAAQLSAWGILDESASDAEFAAILPTIRQRSARQMPGLVWGLVCGPLLALLVTLSLSFSERDDTSFVGFATMVALLIDCWMLGLLAGIATNNIILTRRRREQGVALTPGRQISDYVSPILIILMFAIYTLIAGVELVIGAYSSGASVRWLGGSITYLSGQDVGIIWATSALLFPLCALICAFIIAHTPQVIPDASARTRHLIEWLHARETPAICLLPLMTMLPTIMPAMLNIPHHVAHNAIAPIMIGCALSFNMVMAALYAGFGQTGQLGGHINGWLWQNPQLDRIEGAGTAAS